MDSESHLSLEMYRAYIEKNFSRELDGLQIKGRNAREFAIMFVSCFAAGKGDRSRAIQCVIDNSLRGIDAGIYSYESTVGASKCFGFKDDKGNHIPIKRDGDIAEILSMMGHTAHSVEKIRKQQRVGLAVMTLIDRLNKVAALAQ